MSTPATKPTVYNPSDRELIEFVKRAACSHFSITEDQLINDKAPQIANIRFLCFWLIINNTNLKDYMVANVFSRTRSTVIYGVGLVDIHKGIYRQTLDNLRIIAQIANNFEKKYSWDIPLTNITS